MRKQDKIKQEVDRCYLQIKTAQEKLAQLRSICNHDTTKEDLYSWRPGVSEIREICVDCGELISRD